MCEELKNKIFSFNKYISNQTEAEIMQEYWIDIKQVIQKQQEELEKKDKMIDLMAKELVEAHEWFYSEFDNYTKEDFIKYFEKKAEEDK